MFVRSCRSGVDVPGRSRVLCFAVLVRTAVPSSACSGQCAQRPARVFVLGVWFNIFKIFHFSFFVFNMFFFTFRFSCVSFLLISCSCLSVFPTHFHFLLIAPSPPSPAHIKPAKEQGKLCDLNLSLSLNVNFNLHCNSDLT